MIKVSNEEMLTDAKESVNLQVPSHFLPVFEYIYNLNIEEDLTSTAGKSLILGAKKISLIQENISNC
jgi:hypothetical protein